MKLANLFLTFGLLTSSLLISCNDNNNNNNNDEPPIGDVEEIKITISTQDEQTSYFVGDKFSIIIKDNSGNVIEDAELSTDNNEILLIEGYEVTALKEGSAKIIAKYKESTNELTINISKKEVEQKLITLTKDTCANLYANTWGAEKPTVYNSIQGIKDTIDGVNFIYNADKSIGFAGVYDNQAGFNNLGSFQLRDKSESFPMIETEETLKVDRVVIYYLELDSTFSQNVVEVSVGEESPILEQSLYEPVKTSENYYGVDIYETAYEYDFAEVEGNLKIYCNTTPVNPLYFNKVEIYFN